MNKIIIKGNLVKDVDFTKGKKDKPDRANFSLAVNRSYDKEKADFFFCTAWGKTAEFMEEYFQKGMPCLVSGRMESYKDDEDHTQWSVNVETVEFAGSKKNEK